MFVFALNDKKENWERKGLTINSQNLTNLRFADNMVLISDNLNGTRIISQELVKNYYVKNKVYVKSSSP